MTQIQSETLHGADVENYAAEPVSSGDGISKKPLNSADALEIAIGESSTVEYTIDSDNSPYLEVRANVPNNDDPTLPVNTFRMWFLGIVFTLVGPAPCRDLACILTAIQDRHGCEPVLLHAISERDHHLARGAAYQLSCGLCLREGSTHHEVQNWAMGTGYQPGPSFQHQRTCGDHDNVESQFQSIMGMKSLALGGLCFGVTDCSTQTRPVRSFKHRKCTSTCRLQSATRSYSP